MRQPDRIEVGYAPERFFNRPFDYKLVWHFRRSTITLCVGRSFMEGFYTIETDGFISNWCRLSRTEFMGALRSHADLDLRGI